MYIWKLRGRKKYRQLLENLIPLSANYARKVTVVHDTFLQLCHIYFSLQSRISATFGTVSKSIK